MEHYPFKLAIEKFLLEATDNQKRKIKSDVTLLLRWNQQTGDEMHRVTSNRHTL